MQFFRNVWPIVVIVGTIAGAAWTAAWSVRDFMTTQIAMSEARLSARIAAAETRLTAQVAATDNRLANQIEEVDERLTLQIAELRQYFVDHLEDHVNAR